MEAAMTDAGMTWTDERVELLAKLWSEGLSASQIAAELGGGVTRNAVIGKVHRLGLSGRGKAQAPATPRSRKPIRPADPDAAGEPPIQDAALLPVSTAGPQSEVSPEQAGPPNDVGVALFQGGAVLGVAGAMLRWPL